MATATAPSSWMASSAVALEITGCVLHDPSYKAPALVLSCSAFMEESIHACLLPSLVVCSSYLPSKDFPSFVHLYLLKLSASTDHPSIPYRPALSPILGTEKQKQRIFTSTDRVDKLGLNVLLL